MGGKPARQDPRPQAIQPPNFMPKLSGVFQIFKDLDTLNTSDIYRWLNLHLQPQVIENHFANRLLNPQTIPMTLEEMQIDLAILREGIRLNPSIFYNNSTKTMTIPDGFIERFLPAAELIKAFVDGLSLRQNSQLVAKRQGGGTLQGPIIFPEKLSHPAPHQLQFSSYKTNKIISNNHPHQQIAVNVDDIVFLPQLANQQIDLQIDDLKPIMLNINNLGLVIDFRPPQKI